MFLPNVQLCGLVVSNLLVKKKMLAGYIITNTCFTYVSIMISPVFSSTDILAIKLVAD